MVTSVSPIETEKPMQMPFGGGQTRVGPNNNALDGVHNGATYRIRLSDSCAVAMLPCLKLFWPLVSTAIILYLYAHQQEALWPLCC